MKFYKINYISNLDDKITAIFNTLNINSLHCVRFIKNGKLHNSKNASYITDNGYNFFYLNGKNYGYEFNFTKKSWRRFVKMKVFL